MWRRMKSEITMAMSTRDATGGSDCCWNVTALSISDMIHSASFQDRFEGQTRKGGATDRRYQLVSERRSVSLRRNVSMRCVSLAWRRIFNLARNLATH